MHIIVPIFWGYLTLKALGSIMGCLCDRRESLSHRRRALSRDQNFFERDDQSADNDSHQSIIMEELHKKRINFENFSEFCRVKHSHIFNAILCPITMQVFTDPVLADGHTFERAALQESQNRRPDVDPLTGSELENKIICPNYSLREIILGLIDEYLEEKRLYIPQHKA